MWWPSDFNSVWDQLPCRFFKPLLRRYFVDLFLTTSFAVCNFSDNCISIGRAKLSLIRRKYLSLAVNVLTNSPKILHITKKDLLQLNFLHIRQYISVEGVVVQISTVIRLVYHVGCRKILLNKTF